MGASGHQALTQGLLGHFMVLDPVSLQVKVTEVVYIDSLQTLFCFCFCFW